MSTVYDEKPTTGERYASAIDATNLKVSTLTSGAVDIIIAAGWCGDTLGATLRRLSAEYDSIAADHHRAAADDLTARVLILSHLGNSLRLAKEMVGNLAAKQAIAQGLNASPDDVAKIAGRCLEVYLDPNCRPCDGRGFNGGGGRGHEGPKVLCKRCKGTGHRGSEIGRDDAERSFARLILALMERATTTAEANMAKKLRNHD